MKNFRKKETQEIYQKAIKAGLNEKSCFFCDKSRQKVIKEFEYFILVNNDYPYDEVAKVSHIIFPKRHIRSSELSPEERTEFDNLKKEYLFEQRYQYLIEGIATLSIPSHIHFHLIILKDN